MPSAQTRPSATSSPPSQNATANESSKLVTLVVEAPKPLPELLDVFCLVVTAWNCVHQMTFPPSLIRPQSLRTGAPSSAWVIAILSSCGARWRRDAKALARRLSTTAPPTAPSAPPIQPAERTTQRRTDGRAGRTKDERRHGGISKYETGAADAATVATERRRPYGTARGSLKDRYGMDPVLRLDRGGIETGSMRSTRLAQLKPGVSNAQKRSARRCFHG